MFSVFQSASENKDTYDLYETVCWVEGILDRAYYAARYVVEDDEIADEIEQELEVVSLWQEVIDYCDEEGLDCEDVNVFMGCMNECE